MNRQRILLTILVGVLIASLAYAFLAMPRQESAPPRTAVPPAKAGAAGKGKPAVRLHLELLASEPEPFPATSRDIFRFRKALPPPDAAPANIARVKVVEPPPPPPTAEALLRQALAGYKVLGFLDKGGVRSVFLANGPEVVVVRPGQAFGAGNRFVATEISATELVVSSADRTVTVRISLADAGNREPATIAPVSVPRPGVDIEPIRSAPVRGAGRRVPPRPGVDMTEEPQADEAGAVEGDAGMELPHGEGQ